MRLRTGTYLFYANNVIKSRYFKRATPLLRAVRPLIDRDDVERWDISIGAITKNFYNFDQMYRSARYHAENPEGKRFFFDIKVFKDGEMVDKVKIGVLSRIS